MNTRELFGASVRDRSGRELGTVQEIVVDRITGRISFAVVALAQEDGPSELLPVPWSALAAGADDDGVLRLPLSARRVAEAPTIEADRLDQLGHRSVGVEICSYYGVQPPWDGGLHA